MAELIIGGLALLLGVAGTLWVRHRQDKKAVRDLDLQLARHKKEARDAKQKIQQEAKERREQIAADRHNRDAAGTYHELLERIRQQAERDGNLREGDGR